MNFEKLISLFFEKLNRFTAHFLTGHAENNNVFEKRSHI